MKIFSSRLKIAERKRSSFRVWMLMSSAWIFLSFPSGAFCVVDSMAGRDPSVVVDGSATGQISRWQQGKKNLVEAASDDAFLKVELVRVDASALSPTAEVISGEFVIDPRSLQKKEAGEELRFQGVVRADGRDVIGASCVYDFGDATQLRLTIRLTPLAGLSDYRIRGLQWQQAFSLNNRKRVYFPGEGGLTWDTRYFYQYHVNSLGELLPQPERNEWQQFSLDQIQSNAFRLWRAESGSSSPLVMQHGRNTSPFVQVYDETGGVVVRYDQLSALAPKALRVDATSGATAMVDLWPSFARPLDPRDYAESKKLFGVDHVIRLYGNAGADEAKAARIRMSSEQSEERFPNPEEILQEEDWLRQTSIASSGAERIVTGGLPIAQGLVKDASAIRVMIAGEAAPTQGKPLAFWPDGSIKWALLSFDRGKGLSGRPEGGKAGTPGVTFRDGSVLPITLNYSGAAAPKAREGVRVEEGDGEVAVDNGIIRLAIGRGTQWLKSLQINRHEMLDVKRANRLAYVDYLIAPVKLPHYASLAEGGSIDSGVLEVDQVTIEERGPLRSVIRIEGLTNGVEKARLILRIETTAGSSALKLSHTIEILSKDPRRAYIRGLGLELPLRIVPMPRVVYGGDTPFTLPKGGGDSSTMQQDGPLSYDIRGTNATHSSVVSRGERTQGWVDISDGKVGVIAAIRNAWQQYPKALSVNQRQPAVRVELWPDHGQVMDLRRYSDFPHISQGEGASPSNDWVQSSYYPRDPVVGISRTHEILLHFHQGEDRDPMAIAADFQSPPLLYAGEKSYRESKALLPAASLEGWPRFWENFDRFTAFWLWNRERHQWYGFWDFGDIQHHFGTGYGWIVPPDALSRHLLSTDAKSSMQVSSSRISPRILDYAPANDWAFDNGRWGWANTEGLPNLYLQNEYLRTGRRVLYFAAEALARKSRDVVIRHSGHWFGKGTRHGVQAWSDGNHEARQTIFTEFKTNYFLSGDGRTRDVIEKLYSDIYTQGSVAIDADHSARLYGLLAHWELTGDKLEAEQLKRYVGCFLSPEGFSLAPKVSFPGPVAAGESQKVNDGSMFFHNFGGMHAILEYYELTRDSNLKKALIKMADYAIGTPEITQKYLSGGLGTSNMYWETIAFAGRYADDGEPYRSFLRDALAANWEAIYQLVNSNHRFWSGENASLLGNTPACFFWANSAPYVLGLFPSDIVWNGKIDQQLKEMADKGVPRKEKITSWQSEYDNYLELDDYLKIGRPWMQPETSTTRDQGPK